MESHANIMPIMALATSTCQSFIFILVSSLVHFRKPRPGPGRVECRITILERNKQFVVIVTGRSAVVRSAVIVPKCRRSFNRDYDLCVVKAPPAPLSAVLPSLDLSETSCAVKSAAQKILDEKLWFGQQHGRMSGSPFRFVRDTQELKEHLFLSNSSAVHAADRMKL